VEGLEILELDERGGGREELSVSDRCRLRRI
jgi:hypothetical protein